MDTLTDTLPEARPVSINAFLKVARETSGMTQKDLAERTGISTNMIKQYEREGGSQPTVEKAAKLAHALNFDARDLFMEALEPGVILRHRVAEEPVKEATQRELAEDAIERIQSLVQSRGLMARTLPEVIEAAQGEMCELPIDEIYQVAGPLGLDLHKITDCFAEGVDQDAVCEVAEDAIVAHALYGGEIEKLSLPELRRCHQVVAEALGERWPLEGVPTRSKLSDIFSDDEENETLRISIQRALLPYLVAAVSERNPVVFESTPEGERFALIHGEELFDRLRGRSKKRARRQSRKAERAASREAE